MVTPVGAEGRKTDPDLLLKGLSAEDAANAISSESVGPLEFLAAYRLGTDPRSIDWSQVNRLRLASIARSVAFSMRDVDWGRALSLLPVTDGAAGLAQFAALIANYAGDGARPEVSARALDRYRDPADDRSDLLTALSLGRSSTSRREYPLDDDAWERLAVAASPLFHLHQARLDVADGPSSPLLARHLPKGNGKYRLKAGPVAHDAILQQYALVELLRDRDDCPAFADRVPAVRYARERTADGGIYRTGAGEKRQALSFAYQIDMAIVNGLMPPRREGIFRPYFECWRAFIDFIDARIKQFRHEELQILRLDITGFYDNIRSHAFSDALARPLEKALHALPRAGGELSSFAPLLAPQAKEDAASRSEAFTHFLLRHSFGVSHFDPIDGQITPADSQRGIPQGPDLSAYLANISLFDLDDMMESEIGRLNQATEERRDGTNAEGCSAAYARYVDDVVIVCRDIETASQLRRKVETLIALKGLSLNRKNVTPPPMTRSEARAWITDNRAGFGFSGPLADLPTTEAMDPLADAGEIDRRTALGLLFDPELDNPENAAVSVEKIGIALSAPDIRFNDRASAYRRLWCLAADGLEEVSGSGLSDAFVGLLRRAEPQFLDAASDSERLDTFLAAIEGLDRALRSVVPAGVFSDEVCLRVSCNLVRLAKGVLVDPFGPLERALARDDLAPLLMRYDVRCQVGIIACLAAEKTLDSDRPLGFSSLRGILQGHGEKPALPEGLVLSLLKHDGHVSEPSPKLLVSREQPAHAAFCRLNRTLVELQRAAAHGIQFGPEIVADVAASEPNSVVRIANTILGVWSPSSAEAAQTAADDVEIDAAATLVNVTYKIFSEIVAQRPRLMGMIAKVADAMPLPSPPGLEASGILMWCRADGKLILASAGDAASLPIGIEWTDRELNSIPGVKIREAALPAGCRLIVEDERQWMPADIATLYRVGFPIFFEQVRSNDPAVPVPTAFSFFAVTNGAAIDFSTLRLISWPAPRSSVDGHAFVRVGSSLEARSVHADGADEWRFGWAVRDVCNRAEGGSDDDATMDQQAGTRLDEEFHRREAIVSRVLPRLSGADRWGPGEGTPDNPIPTRIRRALSLLEHFDLAAGASEAAAYLVAAVAEGMFMSERVNALNDMTASGNPAGLLTRASRRASRALPEAAKHWDRSTPPSLPFRRSAYAWQTLSHTIGRSIDILAEDARPPLRALEAGTEALAVVCDLRALAFEIAASLPDDSMERLIGADFELAWVSDVAGLDLTMVDDGPAGEDPSVEFQTDKVVRAFCQVVQGQRSGLNFLRDRITPSGWIMIVAVLTQIVPVRQRGAAARPSLYRVEPHRMLAAEASLKLMLAYFSSASEVIADAPNWPWDVLSQLLEQRPSDISALLRQLTEAVGIEVVDELSRLNPRTGDSQGDRPILRLADGGSISLADWQVDVAYVRGERGSSMETYAEGRQFRFPYSISRRGDQVLGMHLVSRKLAAAAFGDTLAFPPAQSPAVETGAKTTLTHEREERGRPERPLQEEAPTPLTPAHLMPDDYASEDQWQASIEAKRNRSWRNRSAGKLQGTHRVALVQWDVTDSYYSPGQKDGEYEGLVTPNGENRADASLVRLGGVFLSSSEHRRRLLIREVLRACAEFKVDGLVFPEYSMRPETINWLSRQLKTQARRITVWCGTFRVPSGTQLDLDYSKSASVPYLATVVAGAQPGLLPLYSHTAVLTCIRANEEGGPTERIEFFARQKRYPSAAAGEMIRPPVDQPWRPLLGAEKNTFSLGTFTLELVCSEMFPHASSANFIGIIEENKELAARYGLGKSAETTFDHLTKDVYEFAKWTAFRNADKVAGDTHGALRRGEALQRTLIILPAMTTRSADYHIFGQNQYLAAGLVTAFCNAVAPRASCGQSGFIGLDGWKPTDPISTPYGSKAPGIFQLGGVHTGPLGETEAAMVIADLDLLRTADQRPRPHYQHRSLRLVAHLPIIFATERGGTPGAGSHPNNRRQLRIRTMGGKAQTFAQSRRLIARALDLETTWRSQPNVGNAERGANPEYDMAVATTMEALRVLEEFADDAAWLRKRTKSFSEERYDIPPLSPLPALVDWLYVDDRWIPGSKGTEPPEDGEDPLHSDKPLLKVPCAIPEEAPRKMT